MSALKTGNSKESTEDFLLLKNWRCLGERRNRVVGVSSIWIGAETMPVSNMVDWTVGFLKKLWRLRRIKGYKMPTSSPVMDSEKTSVARIVKEINERMMRDQSRDISPLRPFSRKDAALLRKNKPGAHTGQDTNLEAPPRDGGPASGKKTLFFERIVETSGLHGTVYSQDTPESISNLKAPFSVSNEEGCSTKGTGAKDKAGGDARSVHRNRVTFAENIVTDIFYYEGSADVDDSELSLEISDTVPQSVLNTESASPRHPQGIADKRGEESVHDGRRTGDGIDASKPGSIARVVVRAAPADAEAACSGERTGGDGNGAGVRAQARKGASAAKHRGTPTTSGKKHHSAAPREDARTQNIDRKAGDRLYLDEKVQPPYGSPDATRVREEIETIRRSLSIKDLIRIFEIKIRENRP
ncbi:UNVERIFIED_CONTAM: hypothetical protein PYX00_011398 [Menopon gallinae]|uniref:Uncharacterized protein n=1 Tax=Menopon gallinae TaxID=328185 RepID=A0AAW2H7J7_9NEOP